MKMPRERWVRGAVTLLVALPVVVAAVRSTPAPTVSLAIEGRSNQTPWVASDGAFVAVTWGATADGKTDVYLATSRDGGSKFGEPVRVNATGGDARLGGELPPRVALVRQQAAADPEVVVLWTARAAVTAIVMARSRDGGKTFGPPATLQGAAAAGDRGWPSLAIDSEGTAHAIWLDHRGLAAGRTAGAGKDHHRSAISHDGVAMAQKSSLYYASMPEIPSAARELGPGVCYCCKTALAVGPNRRLYAAWRQVYPGNIRDIAFTVSTDGGGSFAAPVRVSEDAWTINGCPDDGPAMAVDATGLVHLVWPTVINGANPEGALFYASTRDGRTFTARTRVPTLRSLHPTHPQIVVGPRGRVVVGWDEVIDGRRVAAAREVTGSAGPRVEFGPVIPLSADEPGLYPVMTATGTGVLAVWATGGTSSVIKVRGISLP